MRIAKSAYLSSLFVLAVAPGCSCGDNIHPKCDGPDCALKDEHEVVCQCTISAPFRDNEQFLLQLCLPPKLNNDTGDAAQQAEIAAMTQQEYVDAVGAFCDNDVAAAVHDLVGFLSDESGACSSLVTVDCNLAEVDLNADGVVDRPTSDNPTCDVPCDSVTCVAPPEGGTGGNCDPMLVVEPGTDDIHPEFCECTQADGCTEISSESICTQPTWASGSGSPATGMMTRLLSLPSDVQLDRTLSSGELTVTVDPPLPCGSDTDTVSLQAGGSMSVYGRCAPGESCQVLLDFSLLADDFGMSFELGPICGTETAQATGLRVRGGTGGTPIAIDANGNGTIPAGVLRVTASGMLGGTYFTADEMSSEPIDVHIDHEAGTFEMPSATLTFPDGEITVHLVGTMTGRPPLADAGEDLVVECTSPDGAAVLLDGSSSSDPDGDLNFFNWWQGTAILNQSAWLGSGPTVGVLAPFGDSTYALSVSDRRMAIHSDRVEVSVVDSTAPTLDVQVTPSVLWPPNKKMVTVNASIVANDACNPSGVSYVLKSITSDEPEGGSPDIQGAAIGTPDLVFQLRAEREGNGQGRTYTIVYTATDSFGNSADTVATVVVPHDQ